jgi:hypothetical protein
MSQFTEQPLILSPLARGNLWVVRTPMIWHVGKENSGETITVPERMITDFASVPQLLWWLYGPWGAHGWAALFHDALYQSNGYESSTGKTYSRKEVDRIFQEIMLALKVHEGQANIMFTAVDLFGWFAWDKHREGYHLAGRLPRKPWETLEDIGLEFVSNNRG